MNRARRRERLLWLLQRAERARKHVDESPRTLTTTTLQVLKNAGRPLLFSRMPRMLRGDGRTPEALQAQFRYVEDNIEPVPVRTVSPRRWYKVLATSRAISRRRKGLSRTR